MQSYGPLGGWGRGGLRARHIFSTQHNNIYFQEFSQGYTHRLSVDGDEIKRFEFEILTTVKIGQNEDLADVVHGNRVGQVRLANSL